MPDAAPEADAIAGSYESREAAREAKSTFWKTLPMRLLIVAVGAGVIFAWWEVYQQQLDLKWAAIGTGVVIVGLFVFWTIRARTSKDSALVPDADHDLVPDDVDPDPSRPDA